MIKNAKKLWNLIEYSKNIAIFFHKSPDFDCLASAISLERILKVHYRPQEKNIRIVSSLKKHYSDVRKVNILVGKNTKVKSSWENKDIDPDLVIIVDTPKVRSIDLGNVDLNFIKSSKNLVVIDHHPEEIINQDSWEKLNENTLFIRDEASSSCCQIIKRIWDLKNEGIGPSKKRKAHSIIAKGMFFETGKLNISYIKKQDENFWKIWNDLSYSWQKERDFHERAKFTKEQMLLASDIFLNYTEYLKEKKAIIFEVLWETILEYEPNLTVDRYKKRGTPTYMFNLMQNISSFETIIGLFPLPNAPYSKSKFVIIRVDKDKLSEDKRKKISETTIFNDLSWGYYFITKEVDNIKTHISLFLDIINDNEEKIDIIKEEIEEHEEEIYSTWKDYDAQ